MAVEIKTVIGQLNIAGGAWQREAPNQVAVREPQGPDVPGAGKGDLFILTEVWGPLATDEDLERQLAQSIRDAYYLSRGAVTASLRRALQATNDQLYRYNQKVHEDKQIVAGAVVLVMRENEAFVAQVGPTAFYAVLQDLIRRYPAQSSWLSNTAEGNDPALGLSNLIEPNLHHLHVMPGDMLILTDSRLASHLALNQAVRAVVAGNAKATIKNLGKTTQKQDGSALTLAIVEADQSAFAALTRSAPTQLGRLFSRGNKAPESLPDDHIRPDYSTSAMETPLQEERNQGATWPKVPQWLGRMANRTPDEVEPSVAAARHSEPVVADEPIYDEPDPEGQARTMNSMAHDTGFHPDGTPHHSSATATSISLGRMLRWATAGVLLFVALLGSGLKNILSMVLPESQGQAMRQAGMQAYKQGTAPVSWTLLRNIVIVIPVVIALIVAVIYLQQGRIREAEYQEFIANAQGKFQQAQAVTSDPSVALSLMSEAEAFLVEAEAIKDTQPEITDLREQMRQAADQIGQVQRLYYLPQLRQYVDNGTNVNQLVVQGVEVYVMDSGTNRIFHHRLDDLGETLLPDTEDVLLVGPGEQVGSLVVDDLVNMTWMPAGGNRQTSDLVIFSNTGLLEYNPNWGITTSALANQEGVGTPVAVSSYFGNFYVLDSQANRLLRYLPSPDGYSNLPEDYFPADQAVNLAGAVDMAIDGAIYVLFTDGRINKYQGGVPVEFSLSGLDRPLNNPVALFTAPDEEVQYLYVADAGNQRIVQLEKDGRFVRQFKPSLGEPVTFANLQDVFVDELGGRLYILDSNSLYVGNMPTLGE